MAYLCSLARFSDSPSPTPWYNACQCCAQFPSPDIICRCRKKKNRGHTAVVLVFCIYQNALEKPQNPRLITELWGLNTGHWGIWRLQWYICTIIIMTECARSHNAEEDYSIVSNFALCYSKNYVCGCAPYVHARLPVRDDVAEGWTDREIIEKFSECLLKMQSLHVGRHQKVLS